MQNKEMTIFKALGIIAVVMGHTGYSVSKFFPPYSFHMALFLFASGYFYKDSYEKDLKLFFIKRFKKIFIPYFLYNLFYALITYIVYMKYDLILGTPPSINNLNETLINFFIKPFEYGHQYLLYLSSWFMIYLFTVQFIFILFYKMLKKITLKPYIHLIIFLFLGLIGTYLSSKINSYFTENILTLFRLFCRLLFGLFFFYMGLFYKNNLENKNLFKTSIFILVLIIQINLVNYTDITYVLVFSDFKNYIFLPILTSLTGIYVCMFLSKALYKILKNKDILYHIGDNTMHIMSNHLLVFFIINLFIVKIHNVNILTLDDISYKFNVNNLWYIYLLCGILIPTFIAMITKKLFSKIFVSKIK